MKEPINYGGQAVVEGVMMRGSKAFAVAVRNPEGEIIIHSEPLNQVIYGGISRIPFLRGMTLLWDALGLGMKSLMFSADVALEEEGEAGEDAAEIFAKPMQWAMVLTSLAMSITLFFALPAFLTGLLEQWMGWELSRIGSNFLEGMVRLTFVVGYIWLIGFMDDIKRLYGYHGAEHKTINAFEAGAPLTPESVATFSLEHPRCGTAFLLTVVFISIIFFTIFPPMSIPVRILTRVCLIPFVAGIAYELIRFSARHQDNTVVRILTKPNMALQRLTTREPDLGMLEVAIASFEQMMALEKGSAAEVKPTD